MNTSLVSRSIKSLGAVLLSLAALGGCALTQPSYEDYAIALPQEQPDTRVANGSIYQSNRDVALFENPVASRVGDVLTIRLVENTTASKKSSTNTSKSTNASLGAGTTVLGRPITVGGNSILNAGIEDSSDFSGQGNSAQSNTLAGDVTVTVAKRYSNGNLLVQGQKWITINQGREYVRIQGIVRSVDVQPDNTILSTKVANASIAYGGQGALADANSKGWLARFFDSPLTPF
ncbi:MAG: flagellar basal body L-ring protein FlgH [Steroidobacteraceae bacterium]